MAKQKKHRGEVVFMMHGLFATAADYVMTPANVALRK